jgi:hypothetical protein
MVEAVFERKQREIERITFVLPLTSCSAVYMSGSSFNFSSFISESSMQAKASPAYSRFEFSAYLVQLQVFVIVCYDGHLL